MGLGIVQLAGADNEVLVVLFDERHLLGSRVPTIVESNLASDRVVHQGPFEHASTLELIESTFGCRR